MLELPFTDPNDYIGVFLLLTGLFLVLAGFGILKIEKITVAKGTRTWFIGLVLTIVGTLFILPPSFITNIPNPDPDHNQKLDNIVNFTKAEDGDFTDFEIRSISAEINGEHLVFTISYDLGANREFVFFDPPAGDIIRHRGDLSANDHETTFEVPISDLAKVDNITINFYTETDPAFVFLEFSDIKRILGIDETAVKSTALETNPIPEPNNIINFVKAEDGDFTDFEIRSISAEINGEHLVFTISYDLDANREFLFFDPPAGDIIRYRGDLSANDHDATFEVPISDLAKVDNITINFYTETDPAFVFLELSDIKRILGNP